jgi:hypothetical protein
VLQSWQCRIIITAVPHLCACAIIRKVSAQHQQTCSIHHHHCSSALPVCLCHHLKSWHSASTNLQRASPLLQQRLTFMLVPSSEKLALSIKGRFCRHMHGHGTTCNGPVAAAAAVAPAVLPLLCLP